MAEKRPHEDTDLDDKIDRLAGWVRLLAVLFRVLIVLGLLLLILFGLFILSTPFLSVWFLVLPIVLITLGILLARLEYGLHSRLFDLEYKQLAEDHADD